MNARAIAALVTAAVTLALPSAAMAIDPPELFVAPPRDAKGMQQPWTPLQPGMTIRPKSMLGAKVQSGDAGRFSVHVVSVPDGHPNGSLEDSGPVNHSYGCDDSREAPGNIVTVADPIYWEGNGRYQIEVSAYPASPEFTCPAGKTSTASFSMDVRATSRFAGEPLIIGSGQRSDFDLHGFVVDDPSIMPDGRRELDAAQAECAESPQFAADGSLVGAQPRATNPAIAFHVPERDFPRTGSWTCVGRGVATDTIDGQVHYTTWTAPLTTVVKEYFAPKPFHFLDRSAPSFAITAKMPDELASGGKFTVRLRRFSFHGRVHGRARKVGGRVKGRTIRVAFRIPKNKCFQGDLTFAGTHLVAPGKAAFLVASVHGRLIGPDPTTCA